MIRPVKTDPFTFHWRVNGAGYEWLPGLTDKDVHLVPRNEPGEGVYRKEPPSALFLEFAALKPSQKAIAAFADEHGDLFNIHDILPAPGDAVIRDNRTMTVGTSLTVWKRAIAGMHALVSLWEQIKLRRIANLKKIIKRDDKGISYEIAGKYVLLAHADITLDAPMCSFAPKDVLLPAKYALQKEINQRLSDPLTCCVPQLAWTPDRHQRIIFRPSNLLAAMWLQFAQAVTEEFQLRICAGCKKYFQVGPGGRRADSKTCGDACRQRKNRST